MNPKELINKLRNNGIKLWAEKGKLKFKAPKGVMSDEFIDLLKDNKLEVMQLLDSEKQSQGIKKDLENRFEPFPITDVQSAYLLGRNEGFAYGGVACHLYLEFEYSELNPQKVETVWNQLIQRHEMLRSIVSSERYQKIIERVPHFEIGKNNFTQESQNEDLLLDSIRQDMGNRVYDTENWPLFDIAVSQTKTRTLMHFSMEFLIADWASMWKLLSEFESLYYHPDRSLPTLELSFRDYITAERHLRETSTYERDKAYWMNRVQTLPPAPILPIATKEPTSSKRFIRRTLTLDATRWKQFKETAQIHGVTPTTAVMAAYAAVLQRWSKSPHFCLNLTVLNRLPLHPQVNQIVGDFTSISLLEVDWVKGVNFQESAKQLNTQLFEDLDHRLFNGVEVIREISKLHGSERALMPIVFTSAIGLVQPDQEHPLRGQITKYGISQTPQVFIDCQAMDTESGLIVNWDTRDGVFPPSMVSDMFDAFENLLNQLSKEREVWNQKELITLPKRQIDLRATIDHPQVEISPALLHQPIVQKIRENPDKIAVIDKEKKISYRQLGLQATSIARELRKQGCEQQDNVVITIPKSHHQVASVLGTLSLNAVYVPVDVNQPEDRRFVMIENAGAHYILTVRDIGLRFPENAKVIFVDDLEPSKSIDLKEEGKIDQLAYVIYTSGSTGEPKGVLITHRAAVNTIVDINHRFDLSQNDTVLGLAQLGFDLSVYDIFGLLSIGGTLVYPNPERQNDPSHWFELMKDHQISIWNTVPALMQMLVDYLESEGDYSLPAFRLAMLSGDWIPLPLPDRLKEKLPEVQLISLGGATEASIWSIFHPYKGLQSHWNSIPYGKPLTNQGFRILDPQLRDCPEWVIGDLYIIGEGLAIGYLNDDLLTKERFFQHPEDGKRMYKTGDLGRYTPSGDIEFLGRKDKQIKIRGHRIELGEIEAAIEKHPDISAASVICQETERVKTLHGFAQSNHFDDSDEQTDQEDFRMLTESIHKEAIMGLEDLNRSNPEAIKKNIANMDQAASYSMIRAFQKINLFLPHKNYTIDEVLSSKKISPKFHWLVQRWIAVLHKSGMLKIHSDHSYRTLLTTSPEEEEQYWHKVRSTWGEQFDAFKFVEYVEKHVRVLTDLLSGKQEAISLLFPEDPSEGDDWVQASSLYNNKFMQYLNASISILLKRILNKDPQKTWKILEVGAGTGATTGRVVQELEGFKFEYSYTDITPYFFQNAKQKYQDKAEVKFRTYDMDRNYRKQGLYPNSFDLVIAGGGVFIGSKDIQKALKQVYELVLPGGWFVCHEPTHEENWLLISQFFMMPTPQDDLRIDTSCLNKSDWLQLLKDRGSKATLCLPDSDCPLSAFRNHVFATPVKSDKASVSSEKIKTYLKKKLPDYMIPSKFQMVDGLPLTSNGKIDTKILKEWVIDSSGEYDPNNNENFYDKNNIEIHKIESALKEYYLLSNTKVLVHESTLLAFLEPKINKNVECDGDRDLKVSQNLSEKLHKTSLKEINFSDSQTATTGSNLLDQAVFYSMIDGLCKMGFFNNKKRYKAEEIIKSDQISSKFKWLIKRWIVLLIDAGFVTETKDHYLELKPFLKDFSSFDEIWINVRKRWAIELGGSEKFIEYVQNNARKIPELLSGVQDPVELLFPEGSYEYVDALYVDNPISKYLNTVICQLISQIASSKKETLRILEVGAGTGATTKKVLKALKDHSFEYLFTDIAQAFVTNAKANLSHCDNVKFVRFDINKDYRSQGIYPNSFDVIIAVGVLENAKNIPQTLKRIKEIVSPNGWFIFTEPTVEHSWIMASQAFMMQEPEDNLRIESSYLNRGDWYNLTSEMGSGEVLHLPSTEDNLSRWNIDLFATQIKKYHSKITLSDITSFLEHKLPSNMIPDQIQIVDQIPTQESGEIDINKLTSWKVASKNTKTSKIRWNAIEDQWQSELEKKISSICKEILSVNKLGREEDFNNYGADSLVIAQMAGKLRDEFSEKGYAELTFDKLLKNILITPTVAGITQFLEMQKAEANNHNVLFVKKAVSNNSNIGAYASFGGGQKGPLRVVFPAASGTMDCLRPLIKHLDKQQLGPILGVSVADSNRYFNIPSEHLIEEVAQDYVDHIVKTGHKQVQLIGYCLGGITSVEVSRRLKEQDIDVLDLVMIDSHRVPFAVDDHLFIEVLYFPNLFISVEKLGYQTINNEIMMQWFLDYLKNNQNRIPNKATLEIGGNPELDLIGEVFRNLSSYTFEERFERYVQAMPESRRLPLEMVIRMFKTYSQSFRAASFVPSPYFGDVRFLRAVNSSGLVPGMQNEIIDFWSQVCIGELSVSEIQGNHYNCIEEPDVAHVAGLVAEPLGVGSPI